MNFYDEKETKRIQDAGGRVSPENGYSEEEILKTTVLLRELMDASPRSGFFFVVGKDDIDEGTARAEGVSGVHNMSKKEVLDVVTRSLGMDEKAVMRYSLMVNSMN